MSVKIFFIKSVNSSKDKTKKRTFANSFFYPSVEIGSLGRVARQRSAKPSTPVRIRERPLKALNYKLVKGFFCAKYRNHKAGGKVMRNIGTRRDRLR